MKRRVEQLLNGIFEYEQERAVIRPEELVFTGAPGAVLHGKFFVEGADGQRVHGFVYPQNVRLICDPVEFHGIMNEIQYQFDCSGLQPESMIEGEKIVLCCDCGEYEIPYTVRMEAAGEQRAELPFSDLAGFAELARTNYQRAYRFFLTPEFRKLLDGQPELTALYEGTCVPDVSYRSMEEFLTGAGLKKVLMITAGAEEKSSGSASAADGEASGAVSASSERIPGSMADVQEEFSGVTEGAEKERKTEQELELDFGEVKEPVQEVLQLRKNTWGFQMVSVESDALFVRPERKTFTTDEFAGSTFDLNLILDTNLMHAGKNYARLTVRAGRQTIRIAVTAKKKTQWAKDHQAHIRKIMIKKLEDLYVSFRLQKTDLPAWIEHSVSVINSYKRAGGDDVYADLFLVQLYFADDKKHKAERLLEQIEAQKNKLNTPERYCFYLYISTFLYREASYVDRVEEEVSRQFCRNPASWHLQWILLYLQEKYLNDPDARYEAVAEQFQSGCRSRILYVEAWQALKGNPFLMRHMGEFELHLLRFADQEKVMTAEILRQVANLTMHRTTFDRRLYQILTNGWQLYPSEDLLKAICQILLRGGKTEERYFPWYERGVESGLRMNGLYEAYLRTMGTVRFRELPQIIRMYFIYDTSLNYRKRAALFCSIAENRDSDPQTWLNYRVAMERFVLEQLESGNVTDDLAVLYPIFLRESMLNTQLAKKLIRILFTYEITCDMPRICQVVVRSVRMPGETSVKLRNGKGNIPIYDPDSVLFAVDAEGQRYEAREICHVRQMLEDEKLLAWCAKKVPDASGLVMFLCVQSRKEGLMNERLLPFFRAGAEMKEFSEEFRDELRRLVLSWYMEHVRDESLPEFLEEISCRDYAMVDKTAVITLLAEEGKCPEAFELLNTCGAEDIPLMQLVRICSRMVLELEFEENAMLLSLCYRCFEKGKYDDKLLRYLLLYYEGPVESMKLIWSAACDFGLDTMLLEEKILMMMLFTRQGTQGSEPVFEAYLKKMGRKKLCRAYVNLKAYEYFVKGLPVAEPVFTFIENEYRRFSGTGRLDEQEEVCRLALLQYYARSLSLTETQRVYAAEMLEEFNTRGMRFAFFRRFDAELQKPWQMQGHVFAEYAGNPKSTVYILYRYRTGGEDVLVPEEEYTKEQVPNTFEGIFVKEFTLFADEEIECRFVEELPSEGSAKEKLCSDQWILRVDQEESQEGMYGVLNRLCGAVRRGDNSAIEEALDSWVTLEYLAEKVFTMI